jgi:hypothetical protein
LKGRVIVGFAVVFTAAASQAIIPDVSGAEFINVGTVQASSVGTGTVISPFDVLTARHLGTSGATFTLNGTTYTPIAQFVHPTNDLMILRFETPFANWYDPFYGDVLGQEAAVVGFGLTGTLRPDNSGYDITPNSGGVRRAGRNVFSARQTVSYLGMTVPSLLYDLDGNGIDFFGDGGPIQGEASLVSGDSGGAWLVQIGGVWRIVGVSAFVADFNNNGRFHDFGDGGGAVELRLEENWIRANTVPEPGTMIALVAGVAALAVRRRRRA